MPTLANNIQEFYELSCREDRKSMEIPAQRMGQGFKENSPHVTRASPVLDQDLNCLPVEKSELSEHQESETPGHLKRKKRRAAAEHISRIALDDVVKYFDHPIVEASKKLKVGLTALKKKCREFGISRWPHRKIKSLDGLIQNLQEEVERQNEENKSAAMAVVKRQRMLEKERKIIEKDPLTEIGRETKRFRQDVYKRRHMARAIKNQSPSNA